VLYDVVSYVCCVRCMCLYCV